MHLDRSDDTHVRYSFKLAHPLTTHRALRQKISDKIHDEGESKRLLKPNPSWNKGQGPEEEEDIENSSHRRTNRRLHRGIWWQFFYLCCDDLSFRCPLLSFGPCPLFHLGFGFQKSFILTFIV
jgi:hypothetical protein